MLRIGKTEIFPSPVKLENKKQVNKVVANRQGFAWEVPIEHLGCGRGPHMIKIKLVLLWQVEREAIFGIKVLEEGLKLYKLN